MLRFLIIAIVLSAACGGGMALHAVLGQTTEDKVFLYAFDRSNSAADLALERLLRDHWRIVSVSPFIAVDDHAVVATVLLRR